MARSSRRRGAKMPGVSTNTICALPSIAMPRTSARVVCTLGVTIATLLPTSALISVDLPALGAPISAMKPQRVAAVGCCRQPSARSVRTPSRLSMAAAAACSAARLERPTPFGRLAVRQRHRDAELRIVVRAGALDLAIGRRRQAARLRPFLQHGLGIAQRPHRRAHALAPEPLDQLRRRVVAAVEKHRADQRLADVGEDRGAQPPAGVGLPRRRAEARRRARSRAPRRRRSRARTRSASRRDSSPSSALGKARNSMSEMIKPEHVVAEEFEPLIAAGAAAAGQRRDMRQRALEQIAVLEAVADGLFQRARGGGALAARRAWRGAAALAGSLVSARCAARSATLAPMSTCVVWLRPAPHRTIVNSRLQRTDHGQRQTSQARSPSCDREEDDLRAADDVLERHVADLREAAVGRVVRGCRPS